MSNEAEKSGPGPEAGTEARVVTRRRAGGAAGRQRLVFQRHLLIFLGVAFALVGADLMTSPALQWAHMPVLAWGLVVVAQALMLKTRGYSVGELFSPPREPKRETAGGPPLQYEVVRSRQLRDGVVRAAAALDASQSELADAAKAAADELQAAVERAIVAAREAAERGADAPIERVTPEVDTALDELDELHAALIGAKVLDSAPDDVTGPVREHAEALRRLADELS